MRYAIASMAVIILYGVALAQDHADHKLLPEKHPPEIRQFMKEMETGMKKMTKDMHAIGYTGNPDIDFLSMMIPHHEGAIEMARLVLIYGNDPLVRKIAEDIIANQRIEIEAMKKRLRILQMGADTEQESFPAIGGTKGRGK